MAGMITFTDDTRWTAASWLFDWVVSRTARVVNDNSLAAKLQEIVRENLGTVDFDTFNGDDQQKILRILSDDIYTTAQTQLHLPKNIDQKEVYNLIHQLSDLANQNLSK